MLKTSAQVWEALDRTFASRSKARIVQLCTALVKPKRRDVSMSSYFNNTKRIADTMAAIGSPLGDDEIVSYVLASLGDDYDNFTTSMSVLAGNDDFTLSDLYGHMIAYEARTGDRSSNNNQFQHSANNAARGGWRGGFTRGGCGRDDGGHDSGGGRHGGYNQGNGAYQGGGHDGDRGDNSGRRLRPRCLALLPALQPRDPAGDRRIKQPHRSLQRQRSVHQRPELVPGLRCHRPHDQRPRAPPHSQELQGQRADPSCQRIAPRGQLYFKVDHTVAYYQFLPPIIAHHHVICKLTPPRRRRNCGTVVSGILRHPSFSPSFR